MKKTINVAIGGCSFTIDDDAYNALETYLNDFKGALEPSSSNADVMEEVEARIADLLKTKLGGRQVVDIWMVQEVIDQIGYPQGFRNYENQENCNWQNTAGGSYYQERPVKKLYRDMDDKKIAGVCSGLALFLGIDVVILRVIFLVALICGTAGFWIYIVIWIAAPEARTAAEKCEMRGIPATAENIRRFTQRQ